MDFIVVIGILAAAVFASYKLAIEKEQHKIVWPIMTLLVGPSVFIIQYLTSVFVDKRKIS